MKGNFTKSFGLVETNANEVISELSVSIPSPCSAGYDDIPNDILKLSIQFTPNILGLSKIINRSFYEGQVPHLLYIAKVCPVFKN